MPWLPVLHGLDDTAAFFAGLAASHQFRLARDAAGVLLGFVAFDAGWIDHLYLAPAARGQGIGAALLDCALADGRPRQLWCFAGNGPARRFYERQGFAAVEWTDGRGNEEGCADVRYRHPGRRLPAG
ncbi:GNAT family N-acetyltransferase [Chitinimonas koreensis]|nr:GNAT family N-acetyltransferase [Chitinimonas koreensis]